MALQISFPSVFGIPAEYYHICEVQWDKTIGQVVVQLAGYASEEARNFPNSRPIDRKTVSLDAPQDLAMDLPALYAGVKALDEWAEAQDC